MCRLQFYRNMQKKSTNPSIRTLVFFLQCRLLRVFRILPYAHPGNYVPTFFVYLCHTCLIVYVAEMLEKTIMFHLAQRRCCGVSYSLFDVKYVIAASLLRKI